MTMNETVALGKPLAAEGADAPVLYPALGAVFHLDALVPGDAEALDAAHAILADWIGPSLRWTAGTGYRVVKPFEASDFELATCYPAQLKNPYPAPRHEIDAVARRKHAASLDYFEVAMHGGAKNNVASPYSYRFYGIIPFPDDAASNQVFQTRAVLAFTVPLAWPLEDFRARTCAVAEKLRLRWGAAGLTYSGWQEARYNATRDAVFAHARRYVGYDVALYAAFMNELYDSLRTVSWLTFVGPALLARLGEVPAADDLVGVGPVGSSVVVRAGKQPEEGDLNRLRLPAAYVRADEKLRKVRARTLHFCAPWIESATEKWLRRFERRVY